MNDQRPAWVITGPTSGIGYRTALELAAHGTVVLVGRNADKLAAVQRQIEDGGGVATTVVADFADVLSARQAAADIAALDLPIRGVLNNAGIMLSKPAIAGRGGSSPSRRTISDRSPSPTHLFPLSPTERTSSSSPPQSRTRSGSRRCEPDSAVAATSPPSCGARRVPGRRLLSSRHGRLRHVETGQPRDRVQPGHANIRVCTFVRSSPA